MTNEQLKNILFIDIETAPIAPTMAQLPEIMQELWQKKAKTIKAINNEEFDAAKLFEDKGGIFSEFSRVVCIGIGSLVFVENEWIFRLKSITDNDEKILLNNFIEILERFEQGKKEIRFCGHNIKEFDLPFLCRRMIIKGIGLPKPLQLSNKKPWEIVHLDTLELWKFGDYKNYTSLALLAAVLGIASPKEDIDGSMVGKVFWEEKNIKRIAEYCLRDVLTTARVYLHLEARPDFQLKTVFL